MMSTVSIHPHLGKGSQGKTHLMVQWTWNKHSALHTPPLLIRELNRTDMALHHDVLYYVHHGWITSIRGRMHNISLAGWLASRVPCPSVWWRFASQVPTDSTPNWYRNTMTRQRIVDREQWNRVQAKERWSRICVFLNRVSVYSARCHRFVVIRPYLSCVQFGLSIEVLYNRVSYWFIGKPCSWLVEIIHSTYSISKYQVFY